MSLMRRGIGIVALLCLTQLSIVAPSFPQAGAVVEIRVRILNAHSGKPYVGKDVRLWGAKPGAGLKRRDIVFDLRAKTDSDGVAHFRLAPPLPPRLVPYFWQLRGCSVIPGGDLSTQKVLQSGFVGKGANYTCRIRERVLNAVKHQPREIVLFAESQSLDWL